MKISEVTAQIYKVLNQKINSTISSNKYVAINSTISIAQVYNLYKDKYNNDTITKREFEKKQWSCEIQRKKSMVSEA